VGSHPANLAVRFVLELAAWAAMGYWGWVRHTGVWRFVWAVGLPLVAMAAWGTFRVPGDPGDAPVAVPGLVRLALELVEFAVAAWLLVDAGRRPLGIAFAAIVVVHYAVSYDRIGWMLGLRE